MRPRRGLKTPTLHLQKHRAHRKADSRQTTAAMDNLAVGLERGALNQARGQSERVARRASWWAWGSARAWAM